jgi:hypothetical protein
MRYKEAGPRPGPLGHHGGRPGLARQIGWADTGRARARLGRANTGWARAWPPIWSCIYLVFENLSLHEFHFFSFGHTIITI